MTIQLRQICLVANDIETVVDNLRNILGINSCYVDPGVGKFGLENNLMPVGRNFLEVVAPTQQNTAGGRYLDRRGGDGGYMVITQIDTYEEHQRLRQRAIDNGVRVAHEHESEQWTLTQLHPGDLKAAFLELEYDANEDFDGRWNPVGGTGWEHHVRQDVTLDFIGVELQADDPTELANLWGQCADTPVQYDSTGNPTIAFNNATLRFVPVTDGRGPGLGGLDIAVTDREHILREAKARKAYVNDGQVNICGTRWYLSDA
jgi:hypothetical protein